MKFSLSIFKEDCFLLEYIFRNWRQRVRENMVMFTTDTFDPTSAPRKSSCVFSLITTVHLGNQQRARAMKKEVLFYLIRPGLYCW